MCTRYIPPEQAAIERYWEIGRRNPWKWPHEMFPRATGPFIRATRGDTRERELIVGRWGLIPSFARTAKLTYATQNARFEEINDKASFKKSWQLGKRCLIPALSFDEPCWETGRNVWWRFRRVDGAPWGLAGLWNAWVDQTTGELIESYTMLTINADEHPLMSRMHKPDPRFPSNQQDKRSVVSIELGDVEKWLTGSIEEAAALVRIPPEGIMEGSPVAAN